MPKPANEENLQRIPDINDDEQNTEDWTVPIASRREGRERVISLLYEMDIKGCTAQTLLSETTLTPDPFVLKRFLGVVEHRSQLDKEIILLSKDWDPDRMPRIDRSILQLGLFELLFCPEVPTGPILSEAVELAHNFSTESSGKFINGILSAAGKQIRSQ